MPGQLQQGGIFLDKNPVVPFRRWVQEF